MFTLLIAGGVVQYVNYRQSQDRQDAVITQACGRLQKLRDTLNYNDAVVHDAWLVTASHTRIDAHAQHNSVSQAGLADVLVADAARLRYVPKTDCAQANNGHYRAPLPRAYGRRFVPVR